MIKTKHYKKKIKILLGLTLVLTAFIGNARAEEAFKMDFRTIYNIGPYWKTVKLSRPFKNPVIVCSAKSENNTTPVRIHIRNVRSGSFELKLQTVLNESLASEDVDFIAIEKGHWNRTEGFKLEAMTIKAGEFIKTGGGRKYTNTVNLNSTFRNPVVVNTVIHKNNTVPVFASVGTVTPSSFKLQLDQPCYPTMNAEDVNVIIVEEGRWPTGKNTVMEARNTNQNDIHDLRF